tara:strand:+ start:642 stop:1499 length:858 start_codon:yes stop_codon:yes gene_type:complete
MSNTNDVNVLLGDRLQEFDPEYRQRQIDYTVPQHISEFESSSDKWVRNNLRGNNPFSVQINNTDLESTTSMNEMGTEISRLEGERSLFSRMNSSELNGENQEDTRTVDFRLGEINNGLIRHSLSQEEIERQIDIHNKQNNMHNTPYHNAIHKIGASDLLKGIQEINHISNTFFSEINVNAINTAIRANIKNNYNVLIPDQINNSLFIIMRSIYLQYSQNISTNDVIAEVKYLNKLVIDYCLEKIISELVAYNKYKNDINFLPIPMDNPTDTSDWRQYTYDFTELI